ncbi:hypothetical protein Taro_011528 [Colocasia esculenta]|uniref:Uncharacterized protein n=1 Tax=Colocasia esculenta TaxID=4460 RepID=A0A843UAG7_COLES|nr:hypothetical protein [Colocasia esculenta]
MAEISDEQVSAAAATTEISPAEEEPTVSAAAGSEATGDPDSGSRRDTKPGIKRLLLTLSVLFSFLLGLPFLLKSTEIYRSPLPFSSIESLAGRLQSEPPALPCRFQAVFLRPGGDPPLKAHADRLRSLIYEELRRITADGRSQAWGGCSGNYSVSVAIDSGAGCAYSSSESEIAGCLWPCGAAGVSSLAFHGDDEAVDKLLESALGSGGECPVAAPGGRVYTCVVGNEEDGAPRVVVGSHRHAWITGRVPEADAVSRIGKIFARVFMNGGTEEAATAQGKGEFMPVGSDGRLVLSFSLLNANPNDWIYDWEFQQIDEVWLRPAVESLAPIANISVESQVLYHAPKLSFSSWDERLGSYIFSTEDLPFFVNSNEWHLDTSAAAAGRSKILHFVMSGGQAYQAVDGHATFAVSQFFKLQLESSCQPALAYGSSSQVYIPSAKECPLLLRLPNGEISMTNAFISPMWGGVAVWNPPTCSSDSKNTHLARNKIPPKDHQKLFQVFMGQLRLLFGLRSDSIHASNLGVSNFLASKTGFTEWELDFLFRHHACFNLLSCATTLESLSKLVQSLPRMIVMEEIGKQVKFSLEAASSAQGNASIGIYDASAVSSREARALAEDAFSHPSIMSISYSSVEHYFAIYMVAIFRTGIAACPPRSSERMETVQDGTGEASGFWCIPYKDSLICRESNRFPGMEWFVEIKAAMNKAKVKEERAKLSQDVPQGYDMRSHPNGMRFASPRLSSDSMIPPLGQTVHKNV